MLKTALTGLVIAMLTSSCATNGSATNWCQDDSPILVSKDDKLTPGTARQVLKHNVVGTVVCGWGNV